MEDFLTDPTAIVCVITAALFVDDAVSSQIIADLVNNILMLSYFV